MTVTPRPPQSTPRIGHAAAGPVAALMLLLLALAITQLAQAATVAVNPMAASPGARLTVTGLDLSPSTLHQAHLVAGQASQRLGSGTSDGNGNLKFSATLPPIAAGPYQLVLSTAQGTVAQTAFEVVPGLSLSVGTGTVRAGRSSGFQVSGVSASGYLRLTYLGRTVYGPKAVSAGQVVVSKFVVPADIPDSFPANVELRATLSSPRGLGQSTTTALVVQAPLTGPFLRLHNAASSLTQVRGNQPFRLSGRIEVDGEAPDPDLRFSAWWFGDNGQVVPLGGPPMQISASGDFQFDTAAPSLGSLGAFDAIGPGSVRYVGQRLNDYGLAVAGSQLEIVEGPSIVIERDSDPDVDINVWVQGPDGPIEGVLVRLGGQWPLVDPHNQPNSMFHALALGSSQLRDNPNLQGLPPAGCPPSLKSVYTGSDGGAEYVLKLASTIGTLGDMLQSADQPTWASALAGSYCKNIPGNAGGTGRVCRSAETPLIEFTVEIWASHRGHGYVDNANGEIPETWRVSFNRTLNRFTLTNPRTGQTFQSQSSANLYVNLPKLPDGNSVLIGEPSVTGLRVRARTDGSDGTPPRTDFVRLPDFGQVPSGTSITFSPLQPTARRMEFYHRPDADGPLTSARLLLPSNGNLAQLVPWGEFSFVQGNSDSQCPGDSSGNGNLYRLEFSEPLRQAMRYPNSVWPGRHTVCGEIEVRAGLLRRGSRQVCFNWAAPTGALTQPGSYIVQEHTGISPAIQVSVIGDNALGGQQRSAMPSPPAEYGVGRRENEATRRIGAHQQIEDGEVVLNGSHLGASHKQFNETPRADAEPGADSAAGGHFGSSDWQTLVDQTVRLFQWTWGIPGLFGASVYAELRVLATTLFQGAWDAAGRIKELEAAARMQIMLVIGVDISILFGLLADAGASITGMIGSEMRAEVADGAVVPSRSGLFFLWGIFFDGWVEIGCAFPLDPTCLIPNIREHFVIAEGQERIDGPSAANTIADKAASWIPTPLPMARDLRGPISDEERRALFRHPAVAFDRSGAGLGLMLDEDDRLVAVELGGRLPGPPHVLSEGRGIRSTAVVFTGGGEAVAAWVESTLSESEFLAADLEQRVTAQRVHYATWDGRAWSPKQALWATPGGDTALALASCAEQLLCRNSRVATLAFSHRHGGSLAAPDQRTWYAAFADGSFEAPRLVDAAVTPRLEVSPSVAYVGISATRVVGFVRYGEQDYARVDTRQFRYRHFASGTMHTVANLAGDIATPMLDGAGSTLRLVFTRPDSHTGFAGTRHALHYSQATCDIAGTCSFANPQKVRDAHGRVIYGLAPRLMKGPGGSPLIALRSFGFGPDAAGERVLPGDPIGSATLSGDLIAIALDPLASVGAVRALSNDGQVHFQSAVAFDPIRSESVALSSVLNSSALAKNAESWATLLGPAAGDSRAVAKLGGGSVALNAVGALPDPALLGLSSNATQLNPGAGLNVTLTLANLGNELTAEQAALGRIEYRLDAPTGSDAPLVSVALPALKAGEVRELPILLLVPEDVSPDEGRDLYAVIVLDEALEQAEGGNDHAMRRIGDLPTPFAMESARTASEPFVWIGWEAAEDTRVVGYRIYAEDEPGRITPLGSTPVKGFLDLSASYGQERTYYVTSYSASGTESPLSPPVVAASPPAPVFEPIFRSRFEPAVP
jgi:hypothetical protein